MQIDQTAEIRPATVVVVDDHATNLILLRRILTRRPHLRVLSESDGQRGLDLIRQHGPDLVLLDLHLPTLDGEAIVREIRADPALAAIPVAIISGDATPQTRQRLHDAGADEYVEKPINIQALLDVVDALLGSPALRRVDGPGGT
jgi:CheY-like chemotaxis protein